MTDTEIDRVLHEPFTARAGPLHLVLVFGLSHATAGKYTLIACDLLAGQAAGADEKQRAASLPVQCRRDAVRPAALELRGAAGGH